jgi:hypothetical protein
MSWNVSKEEIEKIIASGVETIVIKHKYHESLLPEKGFSQSTAVDYIQRIGDAFAGVNDPRPLGRIIWRDRKEEKEIMGKVIAFPANASDTEVNNLLNDYWATFSERIPYNGRELNLKKDAYGDYIKPYDYILYRYCLYYPYVAKSKADVNKSAKIRFYLQNKTEENISLVKQGKLLDDATNIKTQLLSSADGEGRKTIDAIFYLMNNYNIPTSDNDRYLTLNKLVAEKTYEFITMAKDPNIKYKAFIQQCVNAGKIINPEGSTMYYMNGEQGTIVMGNNLDQAVTWVKLPENKVFFDHLKDVIKGIPK